MRLAASNIAWPAELDREAAETLQREGATGVELAPTRLWSDLSQWDRAEAEAHRSLWSGHGLEVVALQAVLYGQPDLSIFGAASERRATFDYLGHAIDIAEFWGAPVLVFGSPKNRRVGDRDPAEAMAQAETFFADLAQRAQASGCTIGLEANPEQYECDFLTRSEEAIAFVEAVDHPGLACHLDLGGMILAAEDPDEVIRRPKAITHFHASEPYLDSFGSHLDAHAAASAALHARGFDGYVSIEMRTDPADPLVSLERALRGARAAYGISPRSPSD